MMNTHVNDLQEQLARVCAERDALRDALYPLVPGRAWVKMLHSGVPDNQSFSIDVTAADMRKALAAYGE